MEDFLFESSDGSRYLNFTFGCPLADTAVDKLLVKVGVAYKLNFLHFASGAYACNDGGYDLNFRLCCLRDLKIPKLWFHFLLSNV